MTKSRVSEQIPSMKNWGGIRSVQRRLERSSTIVANREAVAYALLCMANTKLTDIMEWDEHGNITVKPSSKIPEHALQSIKKISATVSRCRWRWTWSRPRWTLPITRNCYSPTSTMRLR